MVTLDYTKVRVSGALQLRRLIELELHIAVNTHGWARVVGEADEHALEHLTGSVAGRELNILVMNDSGVERSILAGIIHEAELVSMGGWNGLRLDLVSGTSLLDQKKLSRSFQAVGNTYSQIAEQVVAAYSGGAAICSVGEDVTLRNTTL